MFYHTYVDLSLTIVLGFVARYIVCQPFLIGLSFYLKRSTDKPDVPGPETKDFRLNVGRQVELSFRSPLESPDSLFLQ